MEEEERAYYGLTRDEFSELLKRLQQAIDEEFPELAKGVTYSLFRLDPHRGLMAALDGVVAFCKAETQQAISRLAKGNRPNEECDTCDARETCWKEEPKRDEPQELTPIPTVFLKALKGLTVN